MKRWAEHFRSVLNTGNPTQLPIIDIDDDLEELDINIDEINVEEIKKAIKKMKNNKAAGSDNIPAELLKVNITATANALHGLLQDIWSSNTIQYHRSGKMGLLLSYPKSETKRHATTGEVSHFYLP
jgi:translation initiation factor 2 alpha subunit (eIF-2alpha)